MSLTVILYILQNISLSIHPNVLVFVERDCLCDHQCFVSLFRWLLSYSWSVVSTQPSAVVQASDRNDIKVTRCFVAKLDVIYVEVEFGSSLSFERRVCERLLFLSSDRRSQAVWICQGVFSILWSFSADTKLSQMRKRCVLNLREIRN